MDSHMDSLILTKLSNILSIHFTNDEVSQLMQICIEQEYLTKESISEDIDEHHNGDSEIIEYMTDKLNWNEQQTLKFLTQLKNALAYIGDTDAVLIAPTLPPNDPLPNDPNNVHPQNDSNSDDDDDDDAQNDLDLPTIIEFIVPSSVMKQKDPRSINDIINCLKKQHKKIPNSECNILRSFCTKQNYNDFNEIAQDNHKLQILCSQFAKKHRRITIFTEYIRKCIYELSPPVFTYPGKFTNEHEKKIYKYYQTQCPGVIRHDKDLLQYILLTSHTEKGLSSELVDIADRITFFDKTKMDENKFSKKYFFKNFTETQADTVAAGLKKYHNRIVSRFTNTPIKFIADKCSAYQKYAILLSQIVNGILEKSFAQISPFMIDLMIIPPGQYNPEHIAIPHSGKNNHKKKKTMYNAHTCMEIGDIEKYLKEYRIKYAKINGFTAANVNDENDEKKANESSANAIRGEILLFLRKTTNNFKLSHQRFCIVIDRRWRLNSEMNDGGFVSYKRLRNGKRFFYEKFTANDDDEDDDDDYRNTFDEGGTGNIGLVVSPQFDDMDDPDHDDDVVGDGKDDDDDDGKDVPGYDEAFYKSECDTIYVYQVTGLGISKKRFDKFDADFCHESLMYLTNGCILPRKDHITGTHIGGQCPEGYFFNLSAHVYKNDNSVNVNSKMYKYSMRWYTFIQSSALRFFQNDMVDVWPRFFTDCNEDKEAVSKEDVKDMFEFDLNECDVNYKRWYYAVKRSD